MTSEEIKELQEPKLADEESEKFDNVLLELFKRNRIENADIPNTAKEFITQRFMKVE